MALHAEAASLPIAAGYDSVPVERRPIVLGRIRFPKKGGMTMQPNSIDRAIAAARYFGPHLGPEVVALRCRVVNRCFAAEEGEPDELIKRRPERHRGRPTRGRGSLHAGLQGRPHDGRRPARRHGKLAAEAREQGRHAHGRGLPVGSRRKGRPSSETLRPRLGSASSGRWSTGKETPA